MFGMTPTGTSISVGPSARIASRNCTRSSLGVSARRLAKGGAPPNPHWYHNVVANPEVTIDVDSEKCQAKAILTEGEERQRFFDNQAAQMPGFAGYQRKTTRVLPVIALEREG
jgi:deazaflavin-dependent oxidoreductase (nitroreductase family)